MLVDEDLIFAFYDAQVPANIHNARAFESWYRAEAKGRPGLLTLTRDELMRHEAAGITTAAFPKTLRLGGIDCAASYLHEPGHPRDGLTVTLPVYALNPASEDRCEWLVPGMLKEKVAAIVKTLPQRPRSRLVPLPEYTESFIEAVPFGEGSLIDVLALHAATRTGLPLKRADFKLELLAPHLRMNLRVVDEHGRQLGESRNLAELKAELGAQARSSFQSLAALRVPLAGPRQEAPAETAPKAGPAALAAERPPGPPAVDPPAPARHTGWTFGELPELMELRQGGQTLLGYPALIDKGSHVEIEIFDEPALAADKHRAGLRRLFALQAKEALKYLERNLPDFRRRPLPTWAWARPKSCASRSSRWRSIAPSWPSRCRAMQPPSQGGAKKAVAASPSSLVKWPGSRRRCWRSTPRWPAS